MAVITIASGVLLAIGSLLPWTTSTFASIGTVTASGLDGAGVITFILGLVIVAGGLVMVVRRDSSIALIVSLATALAASYVAFTTARTAVDTMNLGEFAIASLGVGLLLVVVGTIGSLVSAGGSYINSPATTSS